MVILKFGGSSIASVDRIERVIKIISSAQKSYRKIAVVFSAYQTVTDSLVKLNQLASAGDKNYSKLLNTLATLTFMDPNVFKAIADVPFDSVAPNDELRNRPLPEEYRPGVV